MDTFYVRDVLGNLVPAKYLMDGGAYVVDPSLGLHRSPPPLYNADGSVNSDQNPNGYLIVPAKYTLRQATDFGRYVKALAEAPDDSGPATALATMAQSFWTGSAQDLQRNYTDALGNPVANGAAVPAFQDAASFHLGAVTAVSGIPVDYALYGGGYLNTRRAGQKVPVDISGIYGNNPANANSIRSGFDYINNTPPATQPMQLNSNYTDRVGNAEPDVGVTQGQITPRPVPAPPASPYSVPVPPALQPLVRHFFPQGFDANNTQAWPSAGTSVDVGTQPNRAGSAGAGLGLTPAQLTPQPFAAPPTFDVPVPPALQPLVRHFFPQGFDANNTQAWPSAGAADGAGTQLNPAGSAGAGPDFTRGPITSQQASASPAPPIDVPIPDALRPLVRLFFP